MYILCSWGLKNKQTNPIGLILNHLAFANTIICTNESKDITVFFHLRNFLGNAGCKTVLYLGRVAGGLSICTTCHLSVVQAISISPRTTSWRKLKPQTTWQVLPYLLLFWIFNFLITSNLLYCITAVSSLSRSGITAFGTTVICYHLGNLLGGFFLLSWLCRMLSFRVSWAGAVGTWLSIFIGITRVYSLSRVPGFRENPAQGSELLIVLSFS